MNFLTLFFKIFSCQTVSTADCRQYCCQIALRAKTKLWIFSVRSRKPTSLLISHSFRGPDTGRLVPDIHWRQRTPHLRIVRAPGGWCSGPGSTKSRQIRSQKAGSWRSSWRTCLIRSLFASFTREEVRIQILLKDYVILKRTGTVSSPQLKKNVIML